MELNKELEGLLLTDDEIDQVLISSWGINLDDVDNPQFKMVAIDSIKAQLAKVAPLIASLKAPQNRPKIVCLCGSGRFMKAFEFAEYNETLAGKIVLTIGCNTHDIARSKSLERFKPMLDELHLRKIDLADEVLIVNLNGYIGESTGRELAYAKEHNKVIRYFQDEFQPDYDRLQDSKMMD
jgi:hypothetical protein